MIPSDYWRTEYRFAAADAAQLRTELAAESALVDALTTQRGVDAVAAMRAVAEAREELAATRDGMNGYLRAAREEQREATLNAVEELTSCNETYRVEEVWDAIARPLDSTPLADRIAELEAERTEFLKADAVNLTDWKDHQKRMEKAEARVKELEYRVEVERQRAENWCAGRELTVAALKKLEAENAALRAQRDAAAEALATARRSALMEAAFVFDDRPDIRTAEKRIAALLRAKGE